MSRRAISVTFPSQLNRPAAALRPLWHARRSSTVQPRFSPGTDAAAAAAKLDPLLDVSGGQWTLASDGKALERSFKFKTFAKTWDFMTAVSLQCKLKNHHPEWSNVYNTAFIRWTTHNPRGLSDEDVGLATLCDTLAKDFGEVRPELVTDYTIKYLAYKTAPGAGECCTARK